MSDKKRQWLDRWSDPYFKGRLTEDQIEVAIQELIDLVVREMAVKWKNRISGNATNAIGE